MQAAGPAAAAASAAAGLKADIIRLAGSKYGHDLSQVTRAEVQDKVAALAALALPVKADMALLTGTRWTTVYTTSTGERTPSVVRRPVARVRGA
jgi:hypothetical protein